MGRYYRNSKYSHPKYSEEYINRIAELIKTMTDEEILERLREEFPWISITRKGLRHLIDRFDLERYCVPPKGKEAWELIEENRVQCAVCGRWLRALNTAHLRKHSLTVSEYKEKFGIMKKQPLVVKDVSRMLRESALRHGFRGKRINIVELLKERKIKYPTARKRPRQEVVMRMKRGLQRKAGLARKPRKLARLLIYRELAVRLREKGYSYPLIKEEIEKVSGEKASVATIRRLVLGRR